MKVKVRISPQLSNWLGRNDDCHYTRCGVTFCSSGQKDNFLSQYRHWWGVFTIPKALSIPSIMFLLVTDEGLIIFLTFICTEKEENRKKTLFCLVEKILSPRWCSCRVKEATSRFPIWTQELVLVTSQQIWASGKVSLKSSHPTLHRLNNSMVQWDCKVFL